MTFSGLRALLIFWIIIVGVATAHSSTRILMPVADTTLLGLATNNNAGANTNILAGRGPNGPNHALLKFDLASQIPANAVITSVTLQLTVTATSSTNDVGFNLNRMRVDWNEGTGNGNGGAPALPGESTWSHRFFNTTPWSAPGAEPTNDFEATPSGSVRVQGNGTYLVASTPELVADVQAWLAQSGTNFGWIMRGSNDLDTSSNRRFASREDTLGRQPKLTVQFTVPSVIAVLTPFADTGLRELDGNSNMGGEKFFPVGTTTAGSGNNTRTRGLVRFDLAGNLPTNAVITSATLNLRVASNDREAAFPMPHELHRVLRDWGEGTNIGMRGAPAKTNDATWNSRLQDITTWVSPGAEPGTDFISVPSATTTIGYTNATGYDFNSPQLLGDTQTWLNLPGTNFGWLVLNKFEGTPGTARRISAREDTAHSPRLTLVYVTSDVSDPPVLTLKGATNELIQFSFLAESGRSYSIDKRTSLDSGVWAALTNVGPIAVTTNLVITDALTLSNAFYRVIKN